MFANSSKEALVADNLEESAERSTKDLKFYLHTKQEASLSIIAIKIHEPQMFVGKKGWNPENQYLSQVNGFQLHNEPGNEQNEVVQQSA